MEPEAATSIGDEEDRISQNCDTLPVEDSFTPEGTTIAFDPESEKKNIENGRTRVLGDSSFACVNGISSCEHRKRHLSGGSSGKTKQPKVEGTDATLIVEPTQSTDEEDTPLLENYTLHAENQELTETVSSSQKTEVYDTDDWLQDGDYFDKVVKQNSLTLESSQGPRRESTGSLQDVSTGVAALKSMFDTEHKSSNDFQNQKDGKNNTADSESESEPTHLNSTDPPITISEKDKASNGDVQLEPTYHISKDSLIQIDESSSTDDATHSNLSNKSSSIHQDALQISELLEGIDFGRILRKVQKLQSVPDRVQVAIEELLEEPWHDSVASVNGSLAKSVRSKGDEPAQSEANACRTTHTGMSQVQNAGTSKPSLQAIESVKTDAEQIAGILGMSGVENIYEKVKEHRTKPNRIELVTNQILEQEASLVDGRIVSGSKDGGRDDEDEGASLLSDVTRVLDLVKTTTPTLIVDPNDVYERLETVALQSDRVQRVAADLVNLETPAVDIQPVAPVALRHRDSDLARDPLFRDTQILAKIFPHKDENEIFAHLEAYHSRPNRVALVTEEFLHVEGNSQDSQERVGDGDAPDGAPVPIAAVTRVDADLARNEPDDIWEQFRQNVDALKEIFPDCDPEYIVQQLQINFDEPDRLTTISSHMFAHRNYPRLRDRLERDKKKQQREHLVNLDINLQQFLNMFPEPVTQFYDETKQVSDTYRQHAKIQLHNDFQLIRVRYIEWVWEQHNFHYTPTVRGIKENLEKMSGNLRSKRTCKGPRAIGDGWPEEPDDYFFRELFFARHEEQIINFIKMQKEDKTRRLQEAREQGGLHECGCCFDDEVLFEDMQACPDGHLFCSECVRRSAESAIGEGKVKYSCLQGECPLDFKLATLQAVLSPSTFSLILRKLQEEELRQADIPDLVVCPFCPYATIMPDSSDKLLRCQNPECLKESCRLCGELSHIPLRCEEVEKDNETKMRIFIENKMAEAMLRTCGQCKKRFYKTVGCNKMTCICGASMCYVCREPVTDYSHFEESGRCSNVNNMDKLHEGEVAKAAREAKEEYKRNHPESDNIQLKYDPVTNVSAPATDGDELDDYYDEDEGGSEEEDEDYGENYDEDDNELYNVYHPAYAYW